MCVCVCVGGGGGGGGGGEGVGKGETCMNVCGWVGVGYGCVCGVCGRVGGWEVGRVGMMDATEDGTSCCRLENQ